MSLRIVFMGSPDFAVPSLRRLAERYPIAGVVTQPDRPSGRGRALAPPPVKLAAQELGLELIQPERLREPAAQEQLRAWAPDLIVVAAFGQILRQSVLDLPPYGCLNVHASLLPRWRGAAPIQAAILEGDAQTGATIMRMDPGIDTGPILAQRAIDILPEDTAASLSARLAEDGAGLLLETLPGYLEGNIQPRPQDDTHSSYAPMLSKAEGRLDLAQPVEALERRVRAFQPWPGAFIDWQGQPLKILRARVISSDYLSPGDFLSPGDRMSPGQRGVIEGLPALGAAGGCLLLEEVQPAGKRAMPGRDFLLGTRRWMEE